MNWRKKESLRYRTRKWQKNRTAIFYKRSNVFTAGDSCDGPWNCGKNLEELQEQNHELYQDILPENYENSYGNPAYAQKMLGEYGKVFTFLYTELYGTIAYAFEKKHGILRLYLNCFWKSILHLRRKKFLLRNR